MNFPCFPSQLPGMWNKDVPDCWEGATEIQLFVCVCGWGGNPGRREEKNVCVVGAASHTSCMAGYSCWEENTPSCLCGRDPADFTAWRKSQKSKVAKSGKANFLRLKFTNKRISWESEEKGQATGCILSGFYSLGRVLSGITKCTSRNSSETGRECDR